MRVSVPVSTAVVTVAQSPEGSQSEETTESAAIESTTAEAASTEAA